jgi:hypothetical protein
MEILFEAIVVLHFIGLAALLGGFLVQVSAPTRVVNRAMIDGALTQLVTGLALVGLAETALSDTEEVDHVKVGIKLLILLVITGLVFANRKRPSLATGPYLAIGLLTIANIVVAVFV